MTEDPIITIENGSLKGCIKIDYHGKPYYSFQGIPYAKPPIGDLRFKVPQLPESWSGIKDATKEANGCYSKEFLLNAYVGSEDCLYLNVYTPNLPSSGSTLKPVMVWIHGGGFIMGSGGTYLLGPDFLIHEDVVFVSINYRVGYLGFLNFEDTSLGISGNAGMKDQVMALKWVKKNIVHFGGDPTNITICGESAGGASVHYLVLSPLSKGLFHKAIIQSGTALSTWARGPRSAPAISTALGLKDATEREIYNVLQNMPVEKIFKLQEKMPDALVSSLLRPVAPVIENETADMPFLTQDPLDIMKSGNYNRVPMIIGYTSREGVFYEVQGKGIFDIEEPIPHDLKIPKSSSKSVSDKIKEFYYGSEIPSFDNINQLYMFHGDTAFAYSTYRSVKLHSLTSDKPIYFYRMSVLSNLNMSKLYRFTKYPAACHGDDNTYLFKTPKTPCLIPHSVEYNTMRRFVKLWTEFARSGNPTHSNDEDLINVNWKPVEKDKYHYLEIGENLTMGVNPDQDRMKFWDELYEFYAK